VPSILLHFGLFLRLVSRTNPRPTCSRILRYADTAVKLIVFIAVIKNFNQSPGGRHSGRTAYLEAGMQHAVAYRMREEIRFRNGGLKSLLDANLGAL
jgi:hypothetical protein